MTQGLGGRARVHSRRCAMMPRRPATRPTGLRHGWSARRASSSMRTRPGHWGVSRYNDLYRDRRAALVSQHSAPGAAIRRPAPCDTVLERCDTRSSARDMVRSAHGKDLSRDTIFVS